MAKRRAFIMLNDGTQLESTMEESQILQLTIDTNATKVHTLVSDDDSPWFTFKMSDVRFIKYVKEGN